MNLIEFSLLASQKMPSHATMRFVAALLILEHQTAPMLSRDLVKRLGISKPSITRITDTLKRAGLIDKRRGHTDGRDCWITITAAGRMLVHELVEASLSASAVERAA